jgi:phosphatidylglycerophosphatase A
MNLPTPAWPRALPTGFVTGLATLGPIGRKLPAPGTWGSVAGVAYFWILFPAIGWGGNLAVSALAAWLAVGLCGEAEIRLNKKDPGEVILDEFVAIPLCFLGWHSIVAVMPVWAALLAGFALFRLFDIAKPLGISKLQRLPGGWGVVVDDLAAALAACATLHFGLWLWTHFGQ